MKKIHENFYMSDDETLQYVYHDGLFYIEDDQEEKVVLNAKDVEDLLWFVKEVINRGLG